MSPPKEGKSSCLLAFTSTYTYMRALKYTQVHEHPTEKTLLSSELLHSTLY